MTLNRDHIESEDALWRSDASIDELNAFLARARQQLLDAVSQDLDVVVCICMGNEASDLDSMVSSIMHSYWRYLLNDDPRLVVLPLINIPRSDLSLRPEAFWLFQQVGLDVEALLFSDEVDLRTLHAREGSMQLLMVDHNVLGSEQEYLGDVVSEIIDHHQPEGMYTATTTRRVVARVGSAATLVAEEIFASGSGVVEAAVNAATARLLAGTILIDTSGLNRLAGRTTERDEAMVALLQPYFSRLTSANELFCQLEGKKIWRE